jgi:hypothetical protein
LLTASRHGASRLSAKVAVGGTLLTVTWNEALAVARPSLTTTVIWAVSGPSSGLRVIWPVWALTEAHAGEPDARL